MKKSGTREWSDVSLNIQVGCRNGCVYCYARQAALRRRLIARPEDWTQERLVPPEVRRARVRRLGPGVVMFPTTHDIHRGNVEAAIEAIQLCLDAGRRVLVVTKARLAAVAALCDEFGGTDAAERLAVRVTLTGWSSHASRVWEPHAPSYAERFQALRALADHGLARSASLEPLLEPWEAGRMVRVLAPLLEGGEIWIGLLRQFEARTAWWRLTDPGRAVEAARLAAWQTPHAVRRVWEMTHDVPGVRYKDSYREALAAQGVQVATAGERS